ncbi:autotransporter domain-containing protein [Veillonella sp. 3627]|uniref:autotransporter domain-containing protein n=1 Tax=Veillonella sp. 3627 TaxID=2490953 RepID=UPI000F8F24CA|nr:autotransporter domain-containing protein [Veillonella sp. 3627]
MRKKRLRYVILSAIAGSVLLTPVMAHNYDSYITNPREPVTYIVDGKANTMQLAKLSENDPYEGYDGKHAFKSTNIEDRFESRGAVTRYTRPNYKDADQAISVNPLFNTTRDTPNANISWGPGAPKSFSDSVDTGDAEFNYVALQNGTSDTVYTVNYYGLKSRNARLNVLEMFSGDNLHEIAAVNSATNAIQNRVILRDVGRLRDVIGAEINNGDGSAIDNDVFVAGGKDIDIIYGARAYNTFPATGSLKNNLVTLGAGKVVTAFGAYATTRDEEESFFQGKPSTEKSKEVIGNRVQLGFNPDDKWQADGRSPATVGQIVGGFSATNKANKNTVIIGEGSIGGLGMFKVKNEQSKHSVNGVDTNGIYTDEVPYGEDNTVYKYFRQPGNYYIIGGMSDVEATGNTVDINKSEPFANKQVGIWGGHYILGGSTGDIKSGNTLNVNKVKGITLSHLANFENYNFDLPENTVNGDTILTVTDPHGTDVSNTKINVGVSGAAPVLHNGDSINLIYNSNGVNTTGVQYGKLQQGISLSYDITAKAGTDKKSVVAVVGKNTSGRPATTSTDEVTTNSLSSYTSYLVNTANSTSQPITLNAATAYRDANGKMVFTTDDIGSRIQSRGEETKYERPEGPKVDMSVNPLHEFDSHDNGEASTSKPTTWGPELVNARGGNSAKNNYLALIDDTDQQAFTANVDGSGHAIGNVLELFAYHKSGIPAGVNNKIDKLSPLDKAPNESDKGIIGAAIVTGSGNASKNQVVIQSDDRHYSDIVGAAIIKAEGDNPNNEPNGDAVDNEVVSLGDATLETLYGAISINKNAKGTLKNNRVVIINGYPTVAYGAFANVLDEDETIFKGIRSKQISKEVVGNLVQLGAGRNEKSLVKGKDPATVGQIVGGYSATNKANKNAVIINDGIIGGVGVFKVKNEQKQHNINGVDANGIYTDEVSPIENNSDRKYYNKPGNYYIIGGMSDVEATGNTVDINKAEPFANKQVGIWGGHYILDGSTGDIKSGNTLNVNKVKGITLSHLANFENYNFDLPENAVNGDTILTVTDPHGTDVSNTKINVGVSGAAPVLHNGDSINLIYNSNGVNTTGAQYGKLQQGVSLSYDITAKAGDDKKSVVAVVKSASEETPEKPSTGDATKPVTPVAPSTGDTTKPVTPVTPSTGDTTKPVTPVVPSTGDTTKPSTGNVSVKVLPQTKSLVETRTAVSGFINNGQDSITKAFATHTSGTSQIIAGINHDRMKVETGSYANIKGSHAVLGLGKQSGRTYWGPFLEMGWARYDSHLDSGLRAEGNAKYYGVGLYGKTTLDNGVYVESSVRGGRTNYTYESNELVTASSNVHASYDAHNSYYGAHLGLGKVMSYGNQLEGNVYANVFYSHQGEANATLTGKGLGETYAFDSVNSVRTRLGYKVSKHMSNHNTWYLGVAYEREFSGEARATVKGLSTLAPSLGGSSGLVEAGFTYGSNRDAFSATLNVEGWFGQKRGATLGGSINWKY